ncbi:hypothetical protein DICPUDRAFT_36817 [Dictyostelium purpureum]|uniref:Poly [ADP-ribose] polymerase n=1 Tax=Dictyostelium purpureum TaxID=5786 RepID=F0ZRS3_DICPU|nr:uncharacterized protein DICPUDRAFT_36817 [Dictyostelium purpureum]EGC33358.1 hypothetical protein DICPUDRAFT_36817 [Dictyostelium purpureum]|eukprot:XP_003290109.1 hypothetical protein DICPUDRAFT_36817 [Dictyostelium purpureum]
MATKNQSPYLVEYAKSDRSSCATCSRGINKEDVRIGYKTKSRHFDGMDISWHHLKCKCAGVPKFTDLVHWEYLKWEDQLDIKTKYFKHEKYDPKSATEVQRQKYLVALWDTKDLIGDNLKGPAIKSIIQFNKGFVDKVSPVHLLHTLSDWMLKGRPGKCPTCKNFEVLFNGVEFQCKGWLSEFTKCDWSGDSLDRFKVLIPPELASNKFLSSYKYTKDYPKAEPKYNDDDDEEEDEEEEEEEAEKGESASLQESASLKSEDGADLSEAALDPNREEDEVPVNEECVNMIFSIAGSAKVLGIATSEIKDLINDHGGSVVEDPLKATVMISCDEEVKKNKVTKKVQNAIDNIPIFSVEWLKDLCNRTNKGIELRKTSVSKDLVITPSKLNDDQLLYTEKYFKPVEKKTTTTTTTSKKRKEIEVEVKPKKQPKPGSNILKVHSDYSFRSYEIYVSYDKDNGYTAHNVMLNLLDIESNSNKFYQIQLIKKIGVESYTVFLKWGRVGVDSVGGSKEETFKTYNKALALFAERFFYFTDNNWEDRLRFKKKPRKYFMVALDDGWEDEEEQEEVNNVFKKKREDLTSNTENQIVTKKEGLHERVQDLIRLMFDQDMMKKQLQSMNVDTDKMPLGKIKKSQLMQGYKVLSEIQDLLTSEGANVSKNRLKDCSQRFYTLIPHNFGNNAPPLIDSVESIKAKMQLVEALIDIDIANSLKKQTENVEGNMIENQYLTLNTKFSILDKSGNLYKTLVSYVDNSHDTKQFRFGINVEDILSVDRNNESNRFTPYAKDPKRLLLWHGSRLTNFVGIISQGLRIAPPEAPKTGYRFGKGIYFADTVSKSASYCFTTRDSPVALMLLCEVYVGDKYELLHDKYMEEAPKPFHSTKALGMAAPIGDDKALVESDNVIVPLGKIKNTNFKSSCTHNEYIVYKVDQVKIKYILRVRIDHK